MDIILAVVKNIAVHERYAAEWAKYGIDSQRVDTMHEAIVRLNKGEIFYFVVISEDCIPDFLTQLPIMSDISPFTIIILTSTFTMEKKIIAMRNGADIYVPFNERIEYDIQVIFEMFNAQKRRSNNHIKRQPVLVGDNISLSPSRRLVLVNDKEIKLAKKEFELLRYLMTNKGCYLTHSQLLRKVWGNNYNDDGVLRRTMSSLRTKLSKASPKEFIKLERDIGYKFVS